MKKSEQPFPSMLTATVGILATLLGGWLIFFQNIPGLAILLSNNPSQWIDLIFKILGYLSTAFALYFAISRVATGVASRQRDIDLAARLNLLANFKPQGAELPLPDKDKIKPSEYWKLTKGRAKVTAVISGKGGVGKSAISLGIMEYLSRESPVLLVDFDMPNRGLTSKFGETLPKDITTVFSELEGFRRDILPLVGAGGNKSGTSIDLSSLTKDEFNRLRNQYTFRSDTTGIARSLNLYHFAARQPDKFDRRRRPEPKNCFFMPSRVAAEERFLASDISRLDMTAVALFIRCLANLVLWQSDEDKVAHIILDCHGGQDQIMVGAILAADHLIIVSTPEPGAFFGTKELVDFAYELDRQKLMSPASDVFVVNGYRSSDTKTTKMMVDLLKKRENTVIVEDDESFHDLLRGYRNPSICTTQQMFAKMQSIAIGLPTNSPPPKIRNSILDRLLQPAIVFVSWLKKIGTAAQGQASTSSTSPTLSQPSGVTSASSKQSNTGIAAQGQASTSSTSPTLSQPSGITSASSEQSSTGTADQGQASTSSTSPTPSQPSGITSASGEQSSTGTADQGQASTSSTSPTPS